MCLFFSRKEKTKKFIKSKNSVQIVMEISEREREREKKMIGRLRDSPPPPQKKLLGFLSSGVCFIWKKKKPKENPKKSFFPNLQWKYHNVWLEKKRKKKKFHPFLKKTEKSKRGKNFGKEYFKPNFSRLKCWYSQNWVYF